jgi:hypothetical protein
MSIAGQLISTSLGLADLHISTSWGLPDLHISTSWGLPDLHISTTWGLAGWHIGHHMVFVYIIGLTSAHTIVFLQVLQCIIFLYIFSICLMHSQT